MVLQAALTADLVQESPLDFIRRGLQARRPRPRPTQTSRETAIAGKSGDYGAPMSSEIKGNDPASSHVLQVISQSSDSKAPDVKLNLILERAAEGDQQAWRTLVEMYSWRVFGLLVKQCGDQDLAEEITQATFVQVAQHISRYREEGKFDPWLFRIAMNRLRDEMRRRGRQARTMDMTQSRSEEDGPRATIEDRIATRTDSLNQDPFELISRAEQVEQLRMAVGKLSDADQQILYMRHTAGLSFADIAQSLEEPLGTVLARGHRALAKLRKILSDIAQE